MRCTRTFLVLISLQLVRLQAAEVCLVERSEKQIPDTKDTLSFQLSKLSTVGGFMYDNGCVPSMVFMRDPDGLSEFAEEIMSKPSSAFYLESSTFKQNVNIFEQQLLVKYSLESEEFTVTFVYTNIQTSTTVFKFEAIITTNEIAWSTEITSDKADKSIDCISNNSVTYTRINDDKKISIISLGIDVDKLMFVIHDEATPRTSYDKQKESVFLGEISNVTCLENLKLLGGLGYLLTIENTNYSTAEYSIPASSESSGFLQPEGYKTVVMLKGDLSNEFVFNPVDVIPAVLYTTRDELCFNNTGYSFTTAPTEDWVGSCPTGANRKSAGDRIQECKFPIHVASTTRTNCDAEKGCCWNSKEASCLANNALMCPSEIATDNSEFAKINSVHIDGRAYSFDGSDATHEANYHMFIGETMNVNCTSGYYLKYLEGFDVVSESEANIHCYYHDKVDTGKTRTDVEKMYNNLKCNLPCEPESYDGLTAAGLEWVSGKGPVTDGGITRYATPMKVRCIGTKEIVGSGSVDISCILTDKATKYDFTSYTCAECDLPDLYDVSSFNAAIVDGTGTTKITPVGPGESVTFKCDDGFSYDDIGTMVSEKVLTCPNTGSNFELTPAAKSCSENCPVSPDVASETEKAAKVISDPIGYTMAKDSAVAKAVGMNTMDIIYVPVGYHVDVTCEDNDSSLIKHDADPARTAGRTKCATEGTTMSMDLCYKKCKKDWVDKVIEARGLKDTTDDILLMSGSSMTATVPYGTELKIICKTGNSVKGGASPSFKCDADNIESGGSWGDSTKNELLKLPECIKSCDITGGDNEEAKKNITSPAGIVEVESYPTILADGYSITVECLPGFLIEDTDSFIQTHTCSGSQDVDLKSCKPTCVITQKMTTSLNLNTKLVFKDSLQEPTVTVDNKYAEGSVIELRCIDNEFAHGTNENALGSKELMCGYEASNFNVVRWEDYPIDSKVESWDSAVQCYGIPTLKAPTNDATEANKLTLSVTLPSTQDTTVKIDKIVWEDDAATPNKCTLRSPAFGTAFSCDKTTTEDADTAGRKWKVTITYNFQAPDVTDLVSDVSSSKYYYGPQTIQTPADFTMDVSGTKTLGFKLAAATVQLLKTWSKAENPMTVIVTIKDQADKQVGSKTILLSDITADVIVDIDINSGTPLSSNTHYNAVVATKNLGGTVPLAPTSFTTGYAAPDVTSKEVSSSEVSLTVDIGDVTCNGTLKTVVGSSYEASPMYTSGVATFEITGLTPDQIVKDAALYFVKDGLNSDTVLVTYKAGPIEPVIPDISDKPEAFKLTNNAGEMSWTAVAGITYVVSLTELGSNGDAVGDPVVKEVSLPTSSRRKRRDTDTLTVIFDDLKPGVEYEISVQSRSADGRLSAVVSSKITTFACALTEKTGLYVLTDDDDNSVLRSDQFLPADANKKFTIGCKNPEEERHIAEADGTFDNTTACIGPGKWETHSECELIPAAAKSSGLSGGAVAGIVIACIVLLLIIVILLVLVKRKKPKKKRRSKHRKGHDSSTSKKYSPREEEKQNEGEADIPAKAGAPNGDNHSMEAKVDFGDADDAGEANENV